MSATRAKRPRGARPQRQARAGGALDWRLWSGRLMLALAAAGTVYAVHYVFERLQAMPVERVAFAGDIARADRQSLIDRVEPYLEGGYWGVELRRMRRDLERDPWVYRAVVERVWPAELKITITEQQPIAYWSQGGLLNHRGELFSPAEVPDDLDLPLLDGPSGSAAAVMAEFQRIGQTLADTPLQLRELRLSARGSWRARLDTDVELLLGRERPLYRLERFLQVYRQELHEEFDRVARVDTRYVNGISVAWREDRGGDG